MGPWGAEGLEVFGFTRGREGGKEAQEENSNVKDRQTQLACGTGGKWKSRVRK